MEEALAFDVIGSKTIARLDADGPLIASESQALDLIGACFGKDVSHIVIPKQRLSSRFLELKSGLLGAVVQKFVNYGVVLVLVGDFSAEVKKSIALRDFIRESNKRKQPLFVGSIEGLEALLG